jgi:hypothetical protein
MAVAWKKCNICKKEIAVSGVYWRCSVSTCNSKRTGLSFCSIACWDAHLPFANHKQAGAVEEKAPMVPDASMAGEPSAPAGNKGEWSPAPDLVRRPAAQANVSVTAGAVRRIVSSDPSQGSRAQFSPSGPREILVIASRLKEYITAVSEFNTSANVMDALSDHLRRISNQAIENARADGRRTVMDRDFDFLKR